MANREREYSLDVLKIVATILIVFHHYQQVIGAYWEGKINFYNGYFTSAISLNYFSFFPVILCFHMFAKSQTKEYPSSSFIFLVILGFYQ